MITNPVTESIFQRNKSYGRGHNLVWSYCIASIFLLLIAPILAFVFTGVVLINSGPFPRPIRLILATVMVIALSMMTGSRPLAATDSNDIDGYYYVYQMLLAGDLSFLTHFGGGTDAGGGVEVGLPLLFYLWCLFLPPLTVNGLMFCLSFGCSFLMLIWVEKTFYAGHYLQHPALIGVCILLFNAYFATQLSRQFFSLIILLYAFSAHGRFRPWIYVIFAAFFHLTAIPFFLLYKIVRRGFIGWMSIIVTLFVFRYFFRDIVGALDVLPVAVSEKLFYLIGNDEEYSSADIASLRMILLLSCISFLVSISRRFKPGAEAKPWLVAPWIAGIVHMILLPIPLASLRTTLLVHSIVPGLLAYKMFEGGGLKVRNLRTPVLNILLLYKIFVYFTAEQSGNLFTTFYMLTNFFI